MNGRLSIAWLFMTPAAVLMTVFLLGPLVAVFLLAFTDYQLGAPTVEMIGLANFRQLAGDPVFRQSLGNTLLYAMIVVPGSAALGLSAALLINARQSLRTFYRTVFFLPVMASLIGMAIVWEFMLHPGFGMANHIMRFLGLSPQNWLNDRNLALPVLALIGIWQNFGFSMVLFLAGLANIPADLYDAAEIDGAPNASDRFRLVTWPLLRPVTVFVLVTSAIRSFQVFDTVHALTKGGPAKATEVLLYTIYAEGFEFFRTGYAAALSVVFVLIITGPGLLRLLRSSRKEETV
ncbi:sugar ABC transporter permease [Rhizobium sp. P007]|uniref:carbohydrate ABC transporter permease n=1 Tax=Rhizobium sp. P007 TaxID=285908 RepID=UPI000EBEF3EC|nr:sugar ABC transporter permease [Rhizobium sp. P007]KAB2694128.1 sugar ABC transporter permease [Ochrobactrum sp. Kaboul]CAD7038328.1 sugar ABC transporter permease [Rhizobium sp. P007]HCJ73618.1 ABC transporter permease [Agrobacterium sp.]